MVNLFDEKQSQDALEYYAWQQISYDGAMNMRTIEKYADKLDWDSLSQNCKILWDIEGVEKFADRLNWEIFSKECPHFLITEWSLVEFEDKWDWEQLSSRNDICRDFDILEKFEDKFNWDKVVDCWEIVNWSLSDVIRFYNRFKLHFNEDVLVKSELWHKIVEYQVGLMLREIAQDCE